MEWEHVILFSVFTSQTLQHVFKLNLSLGASWHKERLSLESVVRINDLMMLIIPVRNQLSLLKLSVCTLGALWSWWTRSQSSVLSRSSQKSVCSVWLGATSCVGRMATEKLQPIMSQAQPILKLHSLLLSAGRAD